jgi:hypothetical protein
MDRDDFRSAINVLPLFGLALAGPLSLFPASEEAARRSFSSYLWRALWPTGLTIISAVLLTAS